MDKMTRDNIPNLPNSFWDEARDIRNMLLKWRFEKYGKIKIIDQHPQYKVEPRLAQIMIPLLSIIDGPAIRNEFIKFMQSGCDPRDRAYLN